MVSPTMKTYIAGGGLFAAAIVTFNGFVWQVQRKGWKEQMLENLNNMSNPALKQLPAIGERVKEYAPVELTGVLDNEGSVVVGPRPMPLRKTAPSNEETRSGFLVLTPFQEDETGLFVMVNRGWVPIDAAKSRIQRVQYTGDGFKHTTIRGYVRKEESISSWIWGEQTDANTGPSIGVAWLCSRPYEMLKNYYERRWGADKVEELEKKHGARHWMVEIAEDHSGEDQRMIKGVVYPIRRSTEDLGHTQITPLVHSFYAGFWLTACVMCVAGMRKLMHSHAANVVARKTRDAVLAKDTTRLRDQQAEFNAEVQRVAGMKGGHAGMLNLNKGKDAAKLPADKQPPSQL